MSNVIYVLVMALVTYLVRMIPFTLFRKKVENRFLKSLFYYMPYAVLGAMTFPYIFYSTGSVITATVGTIVAFILSFLGQSLVVVAIGASIAAFVASLLL